jgi:hypothetical protein
LQANETRHGRVTRIPVPLVDRVQQLADDAGLPFAVIISLLLERALDEAPTWLQVAAIERRQRLQRKAREAEAVPA